MTYVSPLFLFLFLPIVLIVYQVTPQKQRWTILLLASVVFFFLYSKILIIFLLIVAIITYYFGIMIGNDNEKNHKSKSIPKKLIISISLVLFFLVYLKYSGFIHVNVSKFIPINFDFTNKWGVPIGISFYTLQSISYLVDIHRKRIVPERNFLKLMLYLCFFPIIIEGPIVRYKDVNESLFKGNSITYHSLTQGLQRIVWGLFKKIVIADRLNTFVIHVFDVDPLGQPGSIVLVGAIAYTLQLYMDFSGMIDVTIGIGQLFNIQLPENFKQPFFAKNVTEFWSRWHITLGLWIKDYIFFPILLSGPFKKVNKKFPQKKFKRPIMLALNCSALFVAWLINGIWHGTGWAFIMFGMYYFFLITLGMICEPLIKKSHEVLKIDNKSWYYKIFMFIKLFVLVIIGELIFRANTGMTAVMMLSSIINNFKASALFDMSLLNYGLDKLDFIVVGITILLVIIVSILKENNMHIRSYLNKQPLVIKWSVYYFIIFTIIIFGAYGEGYIPAEILYGKF